MMTHHQNKGHEATEDCEKDVASLIAEAAACLKQNEGGHKQGSNGVQQGPMHRWQQPAGGGLPLALGMSQPLGCMKNVAHICSSTPAEFKKPQISILLHLICCKMRTTDRESRSRCLQNLTVHLLLSKEFSYEMVRTISLSFAPKAQGADHITVLAFRNFSLQTVVKDTDL